MAFTTNNYNQDLPYKVVEVIVRDKISYKITQQKKHWLFGLSKKYYDVKERVYNPYNVHDRVLCFQNKEQVEKFISENTYKIYYRETVVEEH